MKRDYEAWEERKECFFIYVLYVMYTWNIFLPWLRNNTGKWSFLVFDWRIHWINIGNEFFLLTSSVPRCCDEVSSTYDLLCTLTSSYDIGVIALALFEQCESIGIDSIDNEIGWKLTEMSSHVRQVRCRRRRRNDRGNFIRQYKIWYWNISLIRIVKEI